MERPECRTCPYWDEFFRGKPEEDEPPEGYCRKALPKMFPLEDDNDRQEIHGSHPVMFPDEFCGEHPDFPAYIQSVKTESSTPLDTSKLSVRSRNILRKLNLCTRKDFEEFDYLNLMGIHNCGLATKSEIVNFVLANDIKVKAGLPDWPVQTSNP